MLLSMTGFGEARAQTGTLAVAVEVRAVNNRHLKLTVRGSDPYPMLEAEVEKVVRRPVRRGTVLVHVRVERPSRAGELELNAVALRSYLGQVRAVCDEDRPAGIRGPTCCRACWRLPGVAPEAGTRRRRPRTSGRWSRRRSTTPSASSTRMRADEGRAMAAELLRHHRHIADQLAASAGTCRRSRRTTAAGCWSGCGRRWPTPGWRSSPST